VLLLILAVAVVALVVTLEMEAQAAHQELDRTAPEAVAVVVAQPTQVKDTAAAESEF
jgi:hypothetical protein